MTIQIARRTDALPIGKNVTEPTKRVKPGASAAANIRGPKRAKRPGKSVAARPAADEQAAELDVELANKRLAELISTCGVLMRHPHGWKAEVAEVLGLHPSMMSRILGGQRALKLGTVFEIAQRGDIDVGYFLARNPPSARSVVLGSRLDALLDTPEGSDPAKETFELPSSYELNLNLGAGSTMRIAIEPTTFRQLGPIAERALRLEGDRTEVDVDAVLELADGILQSPLVRGAHEIRDALRAAKKKGTERTAARELLLQIVQLSGEVALLARGTPKNT